MLDSLAISLFTNVAPADIGAVCNPPWCVRKLEWTATASWRREGPLRPAGAGQRCLAFILTAAATIRRFSAGADMIRAMFEVGHSVDQHKTQKDAGNSWQGIP